MDEKLRTKNKYRKDRVMCIPQAKSGANQLWTGWNNDYKQENNKCVGYNDSNMKWKEHVDKAVSESNSSLYAIRMIRKYFSTEEVRNLLTALYYSKLYYGSEICHLQGLTLNLKKSIKLASANACKMCIPRANSHLLTHNEIHNLAKRAMPDNMCMYKHALMLHKLLRNDLCDDELMNLNFQIADNGRSTRLKFIKRQNYDVGKNILLNRLHILNDKIEKNIHCMNQKF